MSRDCFSLPNARLLFSIKKLSFFVTTIISAGNKSIQAKINQMRIHFIYRLFKFYTDKRIQFFLVKFKCFVFQICSYFSQTAFIFFQKYHLWFLSISIYDEKSGLSRKIKTNRVCLCTSSVSFRFGYDKDLWFAFDFSLHIWEIDMHRLIRI